MKLTYGKELIQLKQHDLQVREQLFKDNELLSGYHPKMQQVHIFNAKRLKQIIKQIGYPTISKVGQEASEAAWLIIQHSISDPNFMKDSYELMLQNKTDINLENLAYLYDRIQFFQGKAQRFGTQRNEDSTIYPVENPHDINQIRAQYNLPALSNEDIQRIPAIEKIPELEAKTPGYISWRKQVGWK